MRESDTREANWVDISSKTMLRGATTFEKERGEKHAF